MTIHLTICELDVARVRLAEGLYDVAVSLISPHIALNCYARHKIFRMEDIAVEGGNGPTRQQVGEIIELARSLRDGDHVLVNCHAGQSRSPAAAIIMLIAKGNSPQAAFDQVRMARPILLPNALMIYYADEQLGLGGVLVKIVDDYVRRMLIPSISPKVDQAEIDHMKKLMSSLESE